MTTVLKPVTITASATVNKYDHAGTIVRLSAAAGLTVTLPAATGSGDTYKFFVITTVTTNDYVIQVTGNDVISGTLAVSTDIGGTVAPTAADSDTITMNGSTTGGLIGSYVELVDVAADRWAVSGALNATGTEATPFSAAVS